MDEKTHITLQLMIGERQFPVKTTEEDKHSVLRVSQELQERIRKMASLYRNKDIIDILSMLALDYASKFDELKKQTDQQEGRMVDAIEQLSDNIERK